MGRSPLRTPAFLLSIILFALPEIAFPKSFGISYAEIARFWAYVCGFVVVPGFLVATVLGRVPTSWLRSIVVGWTLGYALEVLAYSLFTIVGHRSAFGVYPLIVVTATVPFAWRRWKSGTLRLPPPISSPAPALLLALINLSVALYMASFYYVQHPLPERMTGPTTYYTDMTWDIALAAEIKHHWPVQDPNVSGEPIHYYLLSFADMAATSQVTGIELSHIEFRLMELPQFLLVVCLTFMLGSYVGRSRQTGLPACIVTLLLGEINPFPKKPPLIVFPFFTDLCLSPTFLYGLTFFLATAYEICLVVGERPVERSRIRWGNLGLIGLLAYGAGYSKASSLPVLLGGTCVLAVWRLAGPILPRLLTFVKNRIQTSRVLPSRPGIQAKSMVLARLLRDRIRENSDLSTIFAVNAVILGVTIILYVSTYLQAAGDASVQPFAYVDYAAFVRPILSHSPGGWLDLVFYLAAALVVTAVIVGGRLVGLFGLRDANDGPESAAVPLFLGWFITSFALLFLVYLPGLGELYFAFFGYAAFSILSAHGLTRLWVNQGSNRSRKAILALAGACFVALQLNQPFVRPELTAGFLHGRYVYPQTAEFNPGLYQGMRWIRDHSNANDLMAVNLTEDNHGRYFYYSAYAERRVLIEGWQYTSKSIQASYRQGHNLYREQFQLTNRVFVQGDPDALDVMTRKYRVAYLIVDKDHGIWPVHLPTTARLAFENGDIAVYAV